MAYDEFIADRIRNSFNDHKTSFYEKRMFGGLCFMVDDKMCCGIHFDKKKNTDLLMARIGEDATIGAVKREGCHPMDFTGRPMKGYVFVTPDGFDTDEDLDYWISLCVAFNPLAKTSKRKK
ncbi:MAG: TfoX/Sxy family protein [Saprospiraceae bacterium]|nr:TfoX/Sxy family protein [Saprospiraceae bacterium]|tara:strand:- start:107 stop:469 length:363 start_codon:yes stop_codon:yes gene_type:complete